MKYYFNFSLFFFLTFISFSFQADDPPKIEPVEDLENENVTVTLLLKNIADYNSTKINNTHFMNTFKLLMEHIVKEKKVKVERILKFLYKTNPPTNNSLRRMQDDEEEALCKYSENSTIKENLAKIIYDCVANTTSDNITLTKLSDEDDDNVILSNNLPINNLTIYPGSTKSLKEILESEYDGKYIGTLNIENDSFNITDCRSYNGNYVFEFNATCTGIEKEYCESIEDSQKILLKLQNSDKKPECNTLNYEYEGHTYSFECIVNNVKNSDIIDNYPAVIKGNESYAYYMNIPYGNDSKNSFKLECPNDIITPRNGEIAVAAIVGIILLFLILAAIALILAIHMGGQKKYRSPMQREDIKLNEKEKIKFHGTEDERMNDINL